MRHVRIDPAAEARPSLCAAYVMSRPPVTITPLALVGDAIDLMTSHRIHYLPVVSPTGSLIGIVNADDLRRPRATTALYVCDVMTRPVVWIESGTPITEAVRLMALHGVGALPVVEAGGVVGIITQSDIVLRVTGKLA